MRVGDQRRRRELILRGEDAPRFQNSLSPIACDGGEESLSAALTQQMFANSRQIQSTQTAPHPRLHEIVRKHLATPYQRRPSEAGIRAFAGVAERLAQTPFVLDAGCGTGASTFALARECPHR